MAKLVDRPLKWHGIVLFSLLIVAGLALTAATAVTKFGDEAKKTRLRDSGTEVMAVVSGTKHGSRNTAPRMRVLFLFDGKSYGEWINGDEPDRSRLRVWVDPAAPDDFVAENGSTDDSTAFFNTWAGMPWGLVLAGVGVFAVVRDRQAKQAEQRKRPHRSR